jgi:hypothetical protein
VTRAAPADIYRRLAALQGVPPEAMAEFLSIVSELLEADEARRRKHRDTVRRSRARQKATTPPSKIEGQSRHDDLTVTSQSPHGDVGFPPKEKNQTPLSPTVANATVHDRKTELVWNSCPNQLVSLGLSARAARSNLGRWLKQAGPDRVLELVEAAERIGTQDPIAYITAALKPSGVRREGSEWIVTYGSEEFEVWRQHYRRDNSARQWAFREEEGCEVRVPSRWPRRREAA